MAFRFRYLIVYVLIACAAGFIYQHQDIYVPVNKPLEQMPTRIGDWQMTGQARFDERVLEVLKPTDYLSRTYRDAKGRRLTLYLGYHGGGPDSGPIHSPKHCLPGSGWQEVSSKHSEVLIGDYSLPVNIGLYQNGLHQELFVYWYQVVGEPVGSIYALKFAEIWNSIAHNRKDSAFIRLSLPVEGDWEDDFLVTVDFLRNFFPHLHDYLPH